MNRKTITPLLILAVILRIFLTLSTPLAEAPDEGVRFARTYYTALKIRFPDRNITHAPVHTFSYPPLYFRINGLLMAPFVSKALPLKKALIRYGPGLRIQSLLVSIALLILSTRLILHLFPTLAPLSLPVLYFLPQFAAGSFWIGMDPHILLIMLLILIKSKSYLTRPYQSSFPIILGILTAIGILTKPLAFMFFPAVSAAILLSRAWKDKRINALILYTCTIILISGWYFLTNALISGDTFTLTFLKNDSVKYFTTPFSFPFYPVVLFWWTWETFIGVLGPANNIRLPFPIYLSLGLLFISILTKGIVNRIHLPVILNSKQRIVLIMLSIMTIVSILQFLFINTTISFQPQGRYFMPLFLFFPIILAALLRSSLPSRILPYLPAILTILFLSLNLTGFICKNSNVQTSRYSLPMGCRTYPARLPPWETYITINSKSQIPKSK